METKIPQMLNLMLLLSIEFKAIHYHTPHKAYKVVVTHVSRMSVDEFDAFLQVDVVVERQQSDDAIDVHPQIFRQRPAGLPNNYQQNNQESDLNSRTQPEKRR